MQGVNENSYLKSTCPIYSWRGKNTLNKSPTSFQHYYLLLPHGLGVISFHLKEVIMESRFNIYTDLQLPLREVLKTLKGSEWQYAISWLKEVKF